MLLEDKLRTSLLRIGNVPVRVKGKVEFNSLPADYKKENFKPVG